MYLTRTTGQRLLLFVVCIVLLLQLRLVLLREGTRSASTVPSVQVDTPMQVTQQTPAPPPLSPLSPSNFTTSLLFVRTQTTKASDEQRWFATKKRNFTNSILLASANAAAAKSNLASNLFCSLKRNAPLALTSAVVWATDEAAAVTLAALSRDTFNSAFSVYFDATADLPNSHANYVNDPDSFFRLMHARNILFTHFLDTLELNFIFTDLDVVFLRDPFLDLNVPYGVPQSLVESRKLDLSPNSATETDGVELESVWKDLPDVVCFIL
ncbi:hypothetical protein BCR33DRAFT_714423 [Rhizoclosmatium globosum]|uniref:Nucleotide-diphospho-sugar transferase domain-containing protein n=1 Tax=Rhizoclosmatium globosum TaxID=329046 RepID=A0A1Y2CNT1_9FUNG|nr:hypothetical protein BCR33DRAFT_714423 [Rhizoclosmatium globosum]|eukprot:ORY48699.1 hypothetical protein BCR33DRAFT_714423 [Rhizoclosmatium globosum]